MNVAFQQRAANLRAHATIATPSSRDDALPAEIAFLREYGVGAERLRAAVLDAERQGVGTVEALLASGAVTDTLFYKSLAHLVDVPFLTGLPQVAPGIDLVRALRTGRLRLADGSWLLAPRGDTLCLLVKAAPFADLVPRSIAVTTPTHFEALVLRRGGAMIARQASMALPTLQPALSARGALDRGSIAGVLALTAAACALLAVAPMIPEVTVGSLFLASVLFRWRVHVAGLAPQKAGEEVHGPDRDLPFYTVLVPLHDESGMVPGLLHNLSRLDYPTTKLEILILAEADDAPTLAALAATPKPPFIRTIAVPPGTPRTKPRALNVGLTLARGTLITVFDAEDRPEADQLRNAAARYAHASPRLACLQGRLAIGNTERLLPRIFALEYAALFDVYNLGLARRGLPLPLGGTSNHFRTSALRDVGGWDAWNVTEDADLGIRLARFGYDVGVLDSTTVEEAPENIPVWIRQRRRWTKGWLQVALVLCRDPSVCRDLGPRRTTATILMLIGLVLGPLATPPVLCLAAWQWVHGVLTSSASLVALATVLPAAAVASILWNGWAGLRARKLEAFAFGIPLLLPYQLLIALAAWGGLWDLLRRPYHWRKTPHGAAALNRSKPAERQRRRTVPPLPRLG